MLRLACFLMLAVSCFGQLYPEGAHVDLYFPHLADGGPPADQWQTSFVFVNPHPSLAATVALYTFADTGQPLNLDMGGGGSPHQVVTIPPSGSLTLRTSITFPTTVTGYAEAFTDLPLQATVLFRRIVNGVPQVEVSAPATLPSRQYLSPATRDLAVALVNIYQQAKNFQIDAIDSNGAIVGHSTISLGPNAHVSFNLPAQFPALPQNFTGSVRIFSAASPADEFLAWTLNVDPLDRNLIATLPPGRLAWPIDHYDRIWLVFRKLLAAAPSMLADMGITDVNLNAAGAVNLVISLDHTVGALARPGVVQIDISVSELISDSPSELAFIVGHELGHVAQVQRGNTLLVLNAEQDADLFAIMLMIRAGFDPYAGAGALAKLNMLTSQPGLLASPFDDLADPHGSFNTRIDSMFATLTLACAQPAFSGYCGAYKFVIHPNFPGNTPLSVKPPVDRVPQDRTQ